MTVTIEVIDSGAIPQLKRMEEQKEIRFLDSDNSQHFLPQTADKKPYDPKEMIALIGSLKMSPERMQEYLDFVHQLRNEWE